MANRKLRTTKTMMREYQGRVRSLSASERLTLDSGKGKLIFIDGEWWFIDNNAGPRL